MSFHFPYAIFNDGEGNICESRREFHRSPPLIKYISRCLTTPYKYLNFYLRRLLNSLPLVKVPCFVFKCPTPGLDYVVFVKGFGPHDIQYNYQQDRPLSEVIVSRKCAETVLRGAKRAVLMLKKGIKLQFRLVLNNPVVTVN
ncbi:hypothetical protein Hanom_Chr02g00114291 [Helianthus anomalus]